MFTANMNIDLFKTKMEEFGFTFNNCEPKLALIGLIKFYKEATGSVFEENKIEAVQAELKALEQTLGLDLTEKINELNSLSKYTDTVTLKFVISNKEALIREVFIPLGLSYNDNSEFMIDIFDYLILKFSFSKKLYSYNYLFGSHYNLDLSLLNNKQLVNTRYNRGITEVKLKNKSSNLVKKILGTLENESLNKTAFLRHLDNRIEEHRDEKGFFEEIVKLKEIVSNQERLFSSTVII